MYTKKWVEPHHDSYDHDTLISVATEALQSIEYNYIIDSDGEQLFADLETLSNLKSIATEQVSDSYLDYAGMIYAVNDIKTRWLMSETVGLEHAVSPREMFINEVDIALEGVLSTIGNWISSKFSTMWKSFTDLFNVSVQVGKWLEKEADNYLEHASGQPFELKWNMYYTFLFINGNLDIARHLRVGDDGRELSKMSDMFYAALTPTSGYTLDAYKWDEAEKQLDRIAISAKADTAIQNSLPLIMKKDSRAVVSALPGSVYLATALTPGGLRKTGWSAIPVEDKTKLVVKPNESKALIPALKKITKLASTISFKSNKEQESVNKAKKALADFEKSNNSGDVAQLKQNIKNAIAYESSVSASITRTLLGLHMVALQSLKQVK